MADETQTKAARNAAVEDDDEPDEWFVSSAPRTRNQQN
jgi:hypothetical protein